MAERSFLNVSVRGEFDISWKILTFITICLLSCFLGCIRSFCVFSLFVSEKKKKKIMTKRIRSKLKDVDVMLVVAVSGTGFA